MAIEDERDAWIAEHGLGPALWAARQRAAPEQNLERFAAANPDTDYGVISAVFGVALAAVAAGAAVRALGTTGQSAGANPPRSVEVPAGHFRYRFTIRFTPLAGYPELKTAWRSDVKDYTHALSLEELDAIELDLMLRFRAEYGFDQRYEHDFIIESITRG